MAQVTLNTNELKGFVEHIITSNRMLQSAGNKPVAVEVVGESGIGKTTSIYQIAEQHNLDLVKLNLAQIEELGDLVGFSTKEYYMIKEVAVKQGETLNFSAINAADAVLKATVNTKKVGQWVDAEAVKIFLSNGWQMTKKKRTSYLPPEWIAGKTNGGILLLDDWNRADPRFIQAVMELVDRQTYISWSLPQDWHIILTSNPDDGNYMVNSIDAAQKTRFISVNLEFNVDTWAEWAEEAGVDSRCINFMLRYPEMVTPECNARSITTFFNAISSFDNFADNLPMVQMIGEGSVGEEFASTFTTFIHNRLDKLIHPKEMLLSEEKTMKGKLSSSVKDDDGELSAAITSILSTRLANYTLLHAKNNKVDRDLIDRLTMLLTSDYFTIDNKYMIARTIINGNRTKFQKLVMNPEISKMITE
jgi:hypothetical protein